MKRTFKGIFAAVLCACVLSGCAGNTAQQSAPEVSSATSTEPASAAPQNSDSSPEISEPQQSEADSTPAEPDPEQSEAETPPSEPEQLKDFSVDWNLTNTWEEGGMNCGGYEVAITNNTGSAVSGWKLTAEVPEGFELTASWNGVFSVSGNILTVTNESYNGEISPGGNSGFGFNFRTPSEFTPTNTNVNGSAAQTDRTDAPAAQDGPANEESKPAEDVTPAIPPAPEAADGSTPVEAHGQLSVKGAQLVDENGGAYQLRGMSTHGLTWFPDFVNKEAFRTLRDDWNTNVVRLAMYIDEWGNGMCYMQNKDGSRKLLEKGVDFCIELGMYVIIDWHVLNPGDPSKYTTEAVEFFDYISEKYADYPNIIYEIANEPNNGAGWSSCIKPYAEKVIPVIRNHDKDAVIIVGTPTWSQDIDQALADPLDFDNVMYALHFYAATHTDWLRERTENCVKSGLPVFVSEFGCCDASGGGANDFGQAKKWLDLLDKYSISYCNWSLANKDETCSAFRPSAGANGNWSDSDLSEVGTWIRNWFRSK